MQEGGDLRIQHFRDHDLELSGCRREKGQVHRHASVMRLIEVIRGAMTSEETFQITMELSRRLGKVPIPVNDGPGFFTTRFITAWLMEAIELYEISIAGIKEIDEMCKLAFGFPMGPFELMDLIGLDTVLHVAEYMYEETKERHYAPPTALKKLVLSGYLGDRRLKLGSKGVVRLLPDKEVGQD